MLKPVVWDEYHMQHASDFKRIMWRGAKEDIKDCPGIIQPETQCSIFMLELSENDRRQLFEGNPVYLCVRGRVPPFALSANLGEMLDLARMEQ